MVTKIDVDKATERAWEVLRRDLARRMAVCLRDRPHPGILLEIEAPEREQTPCSPYVLAYVEDDALTVELSSNHVVHPRFRLDKEAR